MPAFKLIDGQIFTATKAFAEAVDDTTLEGQKICYEGIRKVKVPSNPREDAYEVDRHLFRVIETGAPLTCSAKYKMHDLAKLF